MTTGHLENKEKSTKKRIRIIRRANESDENLTRFCSEDTEVTPVNQARLAFRDLTWTGKKLFAVCL
jgi:hypothetical protein